MPADPIPPPLPSLRALRAVAYVAETGGFGRAAERLGVTRSAVSHLVADLERQLGATLFERTPRGAAPTERCRALLAVVREPIRRIENAVAGFGRDRGEVRVSTVSSFASFWLIPRLAAFHAARPDIHVAVATTMQPVDFDREDMDCAIRHGLGGWPGVETAPLFAENLVAVGRPGDVATAAALGLARFLRQTPLIQISTRPDDVAAWWRGQGFQGPLPDVALTVETRGQAIAAVQAGAGVALVDSHLIGPAARDVAVLPAPPVPLETGYHFLLPPRSAGRRNVLILRDWVMAEARRS